MFLSCGWFSSPLLGLFPPPQFSNFFFESKVWNAFSEVFQVQIRQNFEKHVPKFVFKAKKKVGKHFPNFLTNGKVRISGRGRGEKRIFHIMLS
jgi:hypothetical protein